MHFDRCSLSLEDRAYLDAMPELSGSWMQFGRPAEVLVNWHRTENQGPIGSCQGVTLATLLERLRFAQTGEIVQLSKIFAYIASQRLGGLEGADQGSRTTDGIKLALEHGVPPEALTGYPRAYPGRAERQRILSAENYAAGAPFKARASVKLRPNAEDAYAVIGGGGGISYGVLWWDGLIPRDRVVRSYRPPRGVISKHAMGALGYRGTGELIAVNSHADGPYLITPEAWEQMLGHPQTAAVGLLGHEQPVDWYGDSYLLGRG